MYFCGFNGHMKVIFMVLLEDEISGRTNIAEFLPER